MNPDDAIDFSREAIKTCMMVGGPILAASLVIGLLIGVFQAMTQVQDQTVSFVPKILLLVILIGLCLPWLTDNMMAFAKQSFEKPMSQWAGSSNTPTRMFPDSEQPTHQSTQMQTKSNLSAPERIASSQFASWPTAPNKMDDENSAVSPVNNPIHLLNQPQQTPTKSPFILPHYRSIKSEKSKTNQNDLDG
jgi:flagellar biosynthetic protein FliQ